MDGKYTCLFFLYDKKGEKDILGLARHLFPTHNKVLINQKSLLS